jgi:hypothetical protein
MNNKKLLSILFTLISSFISIPSQAELHMDRFEHPLYVGLTGGWGSTTWGNLVPKDEHDIALSLATPTRAVEGGFMWGLQVGCELIPTFAIEASYMHYPNATLYFDKKSFFTFEHHGQTEVVTRTERVGANTKFMVFIPKTDIRAYASAGLAEIHRVDQIVDRWRLSPLFGLGLNYQATEHTMVELGTEVVAGYGEAETEPAIHYVPFLYSGFVRFAYRFG